ncbi:MAG: glutamate 5-kinase, partial [Lachnospiraceae bacterium]
IAAGFRRLGYGSRPTSVAAKQACAAAGQGLLMEEYTKFLLDRGYVSAQLLLTRGDFVDRRRYTNAFNALELLLKKGAVPIVNENDTVSLEELKLGDNDTLGAYLAAMLHANLLILLTDVDGLYTANPSKDKTARRIDRIDKITKDIENAAAGTGSSNGTGGMITKIRAAKIATRAGVPVFITSSSGENPIVKAVSGEGVGTLFTARYSLKTKLQWLAFYAQASGNLFVDAGAADAVMKNDRSLLPAGIVAVEGDFRRGDVVCVYRTETHEYLGRGIVKYSRDELAEMIGSDCAAGESEAINRDDWVGAKD